MSLNRILTSPDWFSKVLTQSSRVTAFSQADVFISRYRLFLNTFSVLVKSLNAVRKFRTSVGRTESENFFVLLYAFKKLTKMDP